MSITAEMVREAELRLMARKLETAGYIVIPPSERKTYKIGPFVIYNDPVRLGIGWAKREGR